MALGCADLVAAHPGALVVTVTAGKPPPHTLTEWDRRCGFGEGDDVVGARRREDKAALEQIGARPLWLDFLDRQYAPQPAREDVADALEEILRDTGCDLAASPLGISHPDHVLSAGAAFDVARRLPRLRWLVYEDAIYRAIDGATDAALAGVRADGFTLQDAPAYPPAGVRKQAALDCYTSQLLGLAPLLKDASRPERYWLLVRRP